ncbi:hypothetical protein F2Q70_00009352 [Brassica cretica]|uniref:Fe2OG dioxygenase domain-containing protein n=1 Tax=Brassica cretica TaxID=69181 RepID=A0A8S9M2Q1_BRACR|nr:hypothetical protein F2Q70_00009352 [Brassica cretica]
MEELFDLPIQTKQRNVSSKPFHGYLNHNLYQSFGIDEANLAEKVKDFTQQLWPDHGNQKISETMHVFSKYLLELDVMYSPPPDNDGDDEETKLGLRSHSDKNIITILHQYQVDALETKDEKWFKVKPSQHSFIIMVGDSLCAFLNGRLSSPYHRVRMTAKKTRYSTALFSVPKTGVIIDSPEELMDEEHPRMFKPFEYNNYRDFFNTEAGRIAQSTLHAFCAL